MGVSILRGSRPSTQAHLYAHVQLYSGRPLGAEKSQADHRVASERGYAPSCIPPSENTPSETAWKLGMGAESGLRKRLRGVQRSAIGPLVAPKKCAREAFRYFPRGFFEALR